jgi:hypothetical protein
MTGQRFALQVYFLSSTTEEPSPSWGVTREEQIEPGVVETEGQDLGQDITVIRGHLEIAWPGSLFGNEAWADMLAVDESHLFKRYFPLTSS